MEFSILKTGYGIGHKKSDIPNMLRVFLAEIKEDNSKIENSWIIECNVDDMNPEIYDYLFEGLFKMGASDVYITPIIMKKSRPASKISVLCYEDYLNEISNYLLVMHESKYYIPKFADPNKSHNFPDGFNPEIFSFDILEEAWKNAELDNDKEHVGPYMRRKYGKLH